jgi:hypothetical protein
MSSSNGSLYGLRQRTSISDRHDFNWFNIEEISGFRLCGGRNVCDPISSIEVAEHATEPELPRRARPYLERELLPR